MRSVSAASIQVSARPSVGRTKAIADARFSQDILWPFRISFDLLPELANVDPELLGVDGLIPQFADQKLVGEDLARMLHENPQEIVFLGR